MTAEPPENEAQATTSLMEATGPRPKPDRPMVAYPLTLTAEERARMPDIQVTVPRRRARRK
jgi:hypothetical protein